ncbi:protein kinase domain-containing protein [Streptacidiphilus carbonis]|uniref:protein kinase domain-containing protein n=1 Tax=Streptacidiphilus carbonis TaxID=105422 RepID=UPI00069322E3|nr:protein kinase [Streptacidiphilus carbonis]
MGEHVLGGRYLVSGLLGRGGMAEVHLARDLRLDRPVAVKLLRPDIAVDPTYLARFRREALSAASLNHPGVVAVYDCGEDTVDGMLLPYLVMEHVHGSTLAELLRESAPLPEREALELAAGILDALDYAHARGIVHRDIKPANVMLTGDGRTKVMDFGIARPMNGDATALTQASMIIGTADYLSPEQAEGLPVDARSDLYSTGCLLYELLTGRTPFAGGTPLEVAWRRLGEDPPPPSSHASALSGDCERLVLRALARDRENRFRTAAEMRAAVEAALGSGAAAAAVPGTSALGARTPRDEATVREPLPPTVREPFSSTVQQAPRRPVPTSRRRAVAVSGAVLAVAVAAALALGAAAGGAKPNGVTPNLSGKSLLEARTSARLAGLQVGAVVHGGCPVSGFAPAHVCAQSPAPGSTAAHGTRITVRLAAVKP